MHSMKNTTVAIVLLAISYGLYQYSLTDKPVIDPALTPELDISIGLDEAGCDELAGCSIQAGGELKIPDLSTPTIGSGTSVAKSSSPSSQFGGFNTELPKFSKSPASPRGTSDTGASSTMPVTKPNGSPSADKKPVVAATRNGVQSIQYPEEFGVTKSPKPVAGAPETQIAQREEVPSRLDQGLLEALQRDRQARSQAAAQTQSDSNALSSKEPTSEFDASTTAAASNGFQPNGGDFMTQPIANSKSEFSGVQAQQVSAVSTSEGDFSANGFEANASASPDAQIKQASVEPNLEELDFNSAWPKVDQLVAQSDFKTALKLLSRFYRDDTLNGPQRQRLLGWLDALAGKVIFSAEHHLTGRPYTVKPGESMADIAQRWKVSPQLIRNVNPQSVSTTADVSAGASLKQIPGPFHAEIDLHSRVMTLFLGDLYAGRFPLVVGISGKPRPGDYKVLLKSEQGFAWRDSQGKEYPPGSPQNGYGPNWIGLEGSLCIHATKDGTADGHHGCIGLSEKDAQDVFSILSKSSTIRIR